MSRISRRQLLTSTLLVGTGWSTAQAVPYTYPLSQIGGQEALAPSATPAYGLTVYAHISPHLVETTATVAWQFATDIHFEQLVQEDQTQLYLTDNSLIKLSLRQVEPGAVLYYRFICDNCFLNASAEIDERMAQDFLRQGIKFYHYSLYPQQPIAAQRRRQLAPRAYYVASATEATPQEKSLLTVS